MQSAACAATGGTSRDRGWARGGGCDRGFAVRGRWCGDGGCRQQAVGLEASGASGSIPWEEKAVVGLLRYTGL
jgi:hypothetical protein